jgi:hypothetical protein
MWEKAENMGKIEGKLFESIEKCLHFKQCYDIVYRLTVLLAFHEEGHQTIRR